MLDILCMHLSVFFLLSNVHKKNQRPLAWEEACVLEPAWSKRFIWDPVIIDHWI